MSYVLEELLHERPHEVSKCDQLVRNLHSESLINSVSYVRVSYTYAVLDGEGLPARSVPVIQVQLVLLSARSVEQRVAGLALLSKLRSAWQAYTTLMEM